MILRPFQDGDTDSIIQLIDSIYQEYGFGICLEDAESDLVSIDEHFPSGSFMVLVDADDVVLGTVALTPCSERGDVSRLNRFYLSSTLRGTEYAGLMLEWAYERARELERYRMELWSDVLFERAHRFYEKHGFVHDGTIREMNDANEPYFEKFFVKTLNP